MSPGLHNLGSGDQARDGLEPCPEVERVALAMAKEIGWGTFSHLNPADMRRVARAAINACIRSEADQSSLDTMAGRIEALEEALAEARGALLCANQNYSAQRVDAALRGEQP